MFDGEAGEAPDLPYLNWTFLNVRDHLSDIDRVISEISDKWSVDRMGVVDLSILRVAAAELLYIEDIDTATSINEAVELAKKYGSENSSVFVNGILGALAQKVGGGGV